MGDRWLFRDLDLSVAPGSTLWVRGASGAGKTQLLRRLARLAAGPGELWLDERSADDLDVRTWRAEVCFVGQRPPVADGGADTADDVWHRVRTLRVQRDRPADDPYELASAWGVVPGRWQQPVGSLSGGELQRLWLAIAVARRPAVLLLDEPTSAVDPEATRAIEATLAGRTTVWTTHDPAQGERVADDALTL